jgi:DNA polymerase-3 subunit epsilon
MQITFEQFVKDYEIDLAKCKLLFSEKLYEKSDIHIIYISLDKEIDNQDYIVFSHRLAMRFLEKHDVKVLRDADVQKTEFGWGLICHQPNRQYDVDLTTIFDDSVDSNNKTDNWSTPEAETFYLFFDTETTGLPNNHNAPSSDTSNWPRLVQLGWLLMNEQGDKLSEKNFIVKPNGFTISPDATKVHGITTKQALEEGRNLSFVLDEFIKDFSKAKYIVGHNLDFDKKIVGAELIRLSREDIMDTKKSFCTMKLSVDFCKINGIYGYKYPKLQELYHKLFGRNFDNAHNAANDIEATQQCFWELRRRNII